MCSSDLSCHGGAQLEPAAGTTPCVRPWHAQATRPARHMVEGITEGSCARCGQCLCLPRWPAQDRSETKGAGLRAASREPQACSTFMMVAKLSSTRIMSAASFATSVPDSPMATPEPNGTANLFFDPRPAQAQQQERGIRPHTNLRQLEGRRIVHTVPCPRRRPTSFHGELRCKHAPQTQRIVVPVMATTCPTLCSACTIFILCFGLPQVQRSQPPRNHPSREHFSHARERQTNLVR